MEGVGPEEDGQSSTEKELFDAVADGLIGPFNEAVLVMGSSASGTEAILEVTFEKETQGGIGKEFSTLIKEHTAIGEILGHMLMEPSTEPL